MTQRRRSQTSAKTGYSTSPQNKLWIIYGLVLFVGLGTFFLFSPALNQGFINYDDPDYILTNVRIQGGVSWNSIYWAFISSHSSNWHPLTWISHMLDCQLFGLNPWGHHLTSVVLHSANASLLLWTVHRLTGSVWRSLAVALLFAWHPLRVESVAWVSERKDVLSGFFFFLTLLSYHAYVIHRKMESETFSFSDFISRRYLAVLFFFACGLMSKPMLVTTPFVLLLLDVWPLGRAAKLRVSRFGFLVREKIPLFILTIASCVVTYLVQKADGATAMIANLDFWPRLQNTVVSYSRYIGKTAWPVDLSIFYPFPPDWWPPQVVLGCALILFAVTGLVLWKIRESPFLAVGWFWYLGTLVPVIGLLQVGEQSMADRYTYLPTLGLLLGMVWWTDKLVSPFARGRLLALVASLILAVACLIQTRAQLGHWKDAVSLFRHSKSVTPPYYNTSLNLGIALLENKQFPEALIEFDETIRLFPGCAMAHHNKGTILEELGQNEEALQSYQTAIHLDPRFKISYLGQARIHLKQLAYDKAESLYRHCLEQEPEDTETRFFLGLTLKAQGRLVEAQAEWERVLSQNPEHAKAHAQLAILFADSGKLELSIPHFEEALRLSPEDADYRYNLDYAVKQLDKLRNEKPPLKP